MCNICAPILKGLVKPHEEGHCPLKKERYCGVCARYGHGPTDCPDTVTQLFRSAVYVEQLIPPGLLEEYGITSRTPLKPLPLVEPMIPPMYVPDNSEAIRAALVSMDIKPKICQTQNVADEIRVNKARLQGHGREVIFVDAAPTVPPKRFPLKKKPVTSPSQ